MGNVVSGIMKLAELARMSREIEERLRRELIIPGVGVILQMPRDAEDDNRNFPPVVQELAIEEVHRQILRPR